MTSTKESDFWSGSFFIFFFETIANIQEIFTLTPKLIYHKIKFNIINSTLGGSNEEIQYARSEKYLYSR